MVKKISTVALAALISMPGLAMAAGNSDRVADLEKQMTEMTQSFNAKMQAMQAEIAALKSKKAEAPAEMATAASSSADWAKKISLSGQVRLRGYNLQNMWDFDGNNNRDNWDVFRLKGSLKATVKATDDVTGVIQLTDQTYGEGVGVAADGEGDNRDNKIFLDNAYIQTRNMFSLPVDMTFGRQNLIYGSGFVILDGQSQFASTSIYFDGIKLRYHITDKMFLDGLYMKDQENHRANDYDVNTGSYNGGHGDDITLSGAYFTANALPYVGKTEAYILNRNDEGKSKNIWMFGGRLSNKLNIGVDYSVEAALQRGDAGRFNGELQDQRAWATKLDAGYTFKNVAMTPRIFAGYAFMSGDKPNTTDKNEGWDVFYGGWPQFGDLLAWEFVNIGPNSDLAKVYDYNKLSSTGGEAVYSNLQIMTIGANANFMQNLSGRLSYSKLNFDKTYNGVDDDFGDYYQLSLKYGYNKQVSFGLYAALLAPGKAFKDNPNGAVDDNASEVFWETNYRF